MKLLKFAIALCVGFLLIGESSASVGTSPAQIYYVVMKGESATNQFNIQSDEDVRVNMSVLCPDIPIIEEWFSFEPAKLIDISGNTMKNVKVTLKTDREIPNGDYECLILATPIEDSTENASGMGSNIIIPGAVKAYINVSGDEVIDVKVYKTDASNTEVGRPSMFTIELVNTGNVRVNPKIRVEVMKEGNFVDAIEKVAGYINPGGGNTTKIKWDRTNTTSGEYMAHFDIFIGNKKLDYSAFILGAEGEKQVTMEQDVPFKVYESGYFTKMGKVVEVNADETIGEEEISEIIVHFKNIGEVEITAKSEIKVYSNDKLIELLESNSLSISPGETGLLTSYFKSTEPGLYIMKGKVIYENKESILDDITIKVDSGKNDTVQQEPTKSPTPYKKPEQKKDDSSLFFWIAGFIVLIIIIAAVLRKWEII